MDAGVNTPVGGREHCPDRTATPRRGGRRLGERNAGEGPLGDRVERRIIGRDVGAERLVEALGRERELVPAIRPSVTMSASTVCWAKEVCEQPPAEGRFAIRLSTP